MKLRRPFLPLLAVCICFTGSTPAATDQYWNPGGTGGDGIWGTGPGDKNWNLTADAPAGNTTWQDTGDETANFQTTVGGTITVFDTVTTSGIALNGADYTLNAGVITLVPDAAAAVPFIHTQTGTLTVDSELAGTSGLRKTGSDSLVLSGSNTYSGLTAITAGSLDLTGSLASTTVNISAGASLFDDSGGLHSATVLTNGGTLTMGASDTIGTYTQEVGGSLTGPGHLTATGGAILNGGVIRGNLRGNTFSTGDVLVTGSLGGGFLNVTGGLLTLDGTSTNQTVNIGPNSGLRIDSGSLDIGSTVTNAGTFTVNRLTRIDEYIQSGSGILDGSAELSANDATLNGGTVAGKLNGNTTSTGNVLVSGTLGGGSLDVTGGTLTLTGETKQRPIHIFSGGRLLVANSGLAFAPAVTNDGVLTFNGANMILSYTQNGTGSLDGTGILEARAGSTLNGGTVAGNLRGTTTSTGDVLVSGTLGDGLLDVTGGTLNLTGTSTNTTINIAATGAMIDANGGLGNASVLTNAGTLTVNAADAIDRYYSNGGTLAGSATLATTTAKLNNGSSLSGDLTATTLITSGAVSISGTASAPNINIGWGTLTNTGVLGDSSTHIRLIGDATLIANGTETFALLTTSAAGVATWQGDLANTTIVQPDGSGPIGALSVTRDFTQSPSGTLRLDVSAAAHDLLTVGGTASFGGTLNLSQITPITPFVPIQVVAATAYSGNFSSLTEDLDGVTWFNPTNGTVMTLALPPAIGARLWNSTANQTSTWISLYDDVIDPDRTNITPAPGGGYTITSGIADAGNPDLLNALSATFAPGGLNAAVLDRLSPEVYAGFQDYAIHATRSHQRAALEAPSLGFIQAPQASGAKDAKAALPAAPVTSNPWEYFAAVDYFNVRTDSSPNSADYRISGFGFIAGTRTSLTNRIRVGGYFAGDSGSVDGSLIDADVTGWSLGLYAKALIDDRTHTLITGGLSYGKYSFDGNRSSLIATGGGGWTPGYSGFNNVDGDALELFLGASSIIYQTDKFRLLPAAGLRYVCGGMDGFAETTGSPGSAVTLVVGKDSYQSALAEISLRAEADLSARLTLDGRIGFTMTLGNDDPAALSARFATGNRAFRATAEGLDEDAFFCGLGATWRVRDNFGVGLHWRADFRSDADPENQVGLSAAFRF